MNDKEYRRQAVIESKYTTYNLNIIKYRNLNQYDKQLVWLRALGLMETWSMK